MLAEVNHAALKRKYVFSSVERTGPKLKGAKLIVNKRLKCPNADMNNSICLIEWSFSFSDNFSFVLWFTDSKTVLLNGKNPGFARNLN